MIDIPDDKVRITTIAANALLKEGGYQVTTNETMVRYALMGDEIRKKVEEEIALGGE